MGKGGRTAVWLATLRQRAHRDEGFMLMEVLVAIVVFALMAGAILGGVIVSSNLSRNDRNRVAASHLADRELEITKFQFQQNYAAVVAQPYATNPDPLPGQTAGNPSKVNGTGYTVARTIQALPQGNTGQSACSGGGSVTYLEYLVSVDVTWTKGTIRPVQASTILTPDKSVVSSTDGFLGVGVTDSTGTPVVGQTVNITGPGATVTGVTGPDGCFVATIHTPGSWTAALTGAGYVDFYGNPAPISTSAAQTVTAGSFNAVPMTWAKAATINATYQAPSGYTPADAPIGVAVYNSGITPSGVHTFAAASATNLWPFSDGYTSWAGLCKDADPSTAVPAIGGTRAANQVIAPGGTVATTLPLGAVDFVVKKNGGTFLSGLTVKAVHATDPGPLGCLSGQTLNFSGVLTDVNGRAAIALPYGKWTLQVNGKVPTSGSWPNPTITAASTTTPISLGTVTVN